MISDERFAELGLSAEEIKELGMLYTMGACVGALLEQGIPEERIRIGFEAAVAAYQPPTPVKPHLTVVKP